MQMQEKKVKGFSLLELLVVVTIIGIISGISFKPFLKWRGDRLVRTEALNITSIIKDIFAQVQRGQYSFVQFEISKDDDTYSISSNGMGITKFTDLVRDKYSTGDTLKPFHKYQERCDETFSWDHAGARAADANILTVNNILIDATEVSLGVDGGKSITGDGGKVCFSKDGSYYAPGGAFLEESTTHERLYICSGGSGCTITTTEGEDAKDTPDQNNFFALEWSRFGNITLYKWDGDGWVTQ